EDIRLDWIAPRIQKILDFACLLSNCIQRTWVVRCIDVGGPTKGALVAQMVACRPAYLGHLGRIPRVYRCRTVKLWRVGKRGACQVQAGLLKLWSARTFGSCRAGSDHQQPNSRPNYVAAEWASGLAWYGAMLIWQRSCHDYVGSKDDL